MSINQLLSHKNNMNKELLITVEDKFNIEGRGVILAPALPLINKNFKTIETTVAIENDSTQEYKAVLVVEHLRLINGKSKWQIAVTLPNASKEKIETGSKVFVSKEVIEKLK